MMKDARVRRGIAVGLLAAVLSLPAAPAHAALADLWNKWFPPADTGPKPEDTLVAPFADSADVTNRAAPLYDVPVSPDSDLSRPHRQQQEIFDWLTGLTPDIFEAAPDTYDAHLGKLQGGLNGAAIAQYQTFMQSSNILKTMGDNRLTLHAYVEGQPVMLNSMALDGRFRWLVEEPVALTFISKDAKSYEQPGVTPVNQHVILRVQIGRLPRGQGIDDMQIETFDVRQNPDPPAPPPATASSPQ